MRSTALINHAAEAVRHLEASKAARLALQDAYDRPDQDRALIADLHQSIGFGLKVAEIHALLALAPSAAARDQGQVPGPYDTAVPGPYDTAVPGPYGPIRDERFTTGSRLS